jgi:hypothetical protein
MHSRGAPPSAECSARMARTWKHSFGFLFENEKSDKNKNFALKKSKPLFISNIEISFKKWYFLSQNVVKKN